MQQDNGASHEQQAFGRRIAYALVLVGVGAGAIVWWRGARECEVTPAFAAVAQPEPRLVSASPKTPAAQPVAMPAKDTKLAPAAEAARPRGDDPPNVTIPTHEHGGESKARHRAVNREAVRASASAQGEGDDAVAANPTPGCELLQCALDGWEGACCQKMDREMPYCSPGGPLPCKHPPRWQVD